MRGLDRTVILVSFWSKSARRDIDACANTIRSTSFARSFACSMTIASCFSRSPDINIENAPSHNRCSSVILRPISSAFACIKADVGPSAVGTVAKTPIRLPSLAACIAIASSIFITGVWMLRAATSIAGPKEEHAEKMTSAPAASAACARCVIRASLFDEIPCSRTTVAKTSESTKCMTSASGISSAIRSLIIGSTETNTKLVCRIAIFLDTLSNFLFYATPDVMMFALSGRDGRDRVSGDRVSATV